MVSPTQLCWRCHCLPLRQRCDLYIHWCLVCGMYSALKVNKNIRHWYILISQTPGTFFPGGRSMKTSKIPMFLYIVARVWGSTLTYINMNTVRSYVQTAVNLQRKCLGTPDCKNMENMLIDFISLNVQAKYFIQIILYHFKWDMALWKWPKWPQYMQRTWWQTVATQHTGLT